MASSGVAAPEFYQNVVVMRHGDRIDYFEPMWVSSATRPWDPPLIQQGRVRAFATGRELLKKLPFTLNRVFVSPFLRCVQTAAEVVAALSAVSDVDDPSKLTGDGVPIDPSKIKVSVEYGLCEMMSRAAIRLDAIPKDGNWGFDIPKLEAMLPAGTVDKNVERVYKMLPQWEEDPNLHTRPRYKQIVKDLADKYHTENLLLVTHGEGVGVAFSSFQKEVEVEVEVEVYDVDYCGYVQLRRPIFKKGQSFTAGEFEAIVHNGQTGIKYTQKM